MVGVVGAADDRAGMPGVVQLGVAMPRFFVSGGGIGVTTVGEIQRAQVGVAHSDIAVALAEQCACLFEMAFAQDQRGS